MDRYDQPEKKQARWLALCHAVESLTTHRDTSPVVTLDHFKRGVELEQDGKKTEAEAERQKAVQLSPTFAPAHSELCKLALSNGNAAGAVESCRTAVQNDDSDFDAHLNLGIAYLNLKKYNEAEPELLNAAYMNRSAVTPHFYLGILFLVRNDLDVAQKAFETARELSGGKSLPAVHKYLGWIYMKKDMGKEAIHEFETYLKLVPKALDADKVKKDISDIKAKQPIKNALV